MRTILFKAKKLSDDEWVKGYLVKSPFGTFIEWYDDSICNKEVDIGDYSDWEMIDGKHYCPDCYDVEVIDGVYNVKAK